MRRAGVVIGTAVALCAALTAASPAPAIYHGERAPFSSFGFMVSLRPVGASDVHSCGGTLIAPDIVLTAAHCVNYRDLRFVAVVGADAPDWDTAPRVRVTADRINRDYFAGTNRADIALLRLARPQAAPTVTLADAEPPVGGPVTTVGWGCTLPPPWASSECASGSDHLRTAQQQVVSDSVCNRPRVFRNPHAYGPTSICAGRSTAMANHGDSGGPLLIGDAQTGYTQVGVVSLVSQKPGTRLNDYVSVPVLRAWIDRTMAALHRRAG
jgi:secreted trypsin-like serine protease